MPDLHQVFQFNHFVSQSGRFKEIHFFGGVKHLGAQTFNGFFHFRGIHVLYHRVCGYMHRTAEFCLVIRHTDL